MRTYFTIGTATVAEVKAALIEHGVPDGALFDYVGCGTHRYEVRDAEEWDISEPEGLNLREGITVPAPPAPPPPPPEPVPDPFGPTREPSW